MPEPSRLAELTEKRAALLAELDDTTRQIERIALQQIADGKPKFYVAQDAGVTRRTLDGWIRAAG